MSSPQSSRVRVSCCRLGDVSGPNGCCRKLRVPRGERGRRRRRRLSRGRRKSSCRAATAGALSVGSRMQRRRKSPPPHIRGSSSNTGSPGDSMALWKSPQGEQNATGYSFTEHSKGHNYLGVTLYTVMIISHDRSTCYVTSTTIRRGSAGKVLQITRQMV